jgi:hypothetical protein
MNENVLEVVISKIGSFSDGADYSTISEWLWGCERDLFNIGIVRDNDFMIRGHDPLLDIRYKKHINHLLIHTTGRVIAWSYEERQEIDESSLEEDSRENDWFNQECINAIRNFFDTHVRKPYELDELIYADTSASEKSAILIPDFQQINEELIAYFSKNPEALHSLEWRKFEELLAIMFKNLGFATRLGPGRADGGVDLRLIQRSDIGEMLILVQAKRYAAHRKIQLEPVKALWASVEDEGANKGLLVSTSEFIPAAKQFAARHPYRIELAGPIELQAWLEKVVKRGSTIG